MIFHDPQRTAVRNMVRPGIPERLAMNISGHVASRAEANAPRPCNAADPDSILRRMILPALEVCGVCSKPESEHGRATHKFEPNKVLPEWRGWHAFRRGLATNLNRPGVDDSVIQRILRHSHVAVTQACYIKTASEDAKAAMQKLETALNDTYVTPRQTLPTAKAVM